MLSQFSIQPWVNMPVHATSKTLSKMALDSAAQDRHRLVCAVITRLELAPTRRKESVN
jgi:hypothetical protein